ncbi:uncharacterized protein [Aegilops tauschii subsp. strangulata]|uniref:uncharacterized protein n=1 Tax=Aegilops tauschii subsp. strangulata TaxID=200361 RepID=UPI00098B0E7F|nr:uncharacterized protein LOC109778886 [Aegilops tauschii subsp. strangulata]
MGTIRGAAEKERSHLVNPVTGEQAALPDVTTMGTIHADCAGFHYALEIERFVQVRLGSPHPPSLRGPVWEAVGPRSSLTLAGTQMLQYFYGKVVLSASPHPGCYAAMLILHRDFGAPAFASAEDPVWRLAPSPDAIDDAIHHDGRFYSVTCSGVVQAWKPDPGVDGEMTGTAVAPRLTLADQDKAAESATPRLTDNYSMCHKYLVAAPDGRLMVYVLDGAAGQWEETHDIGQAALFVGLNNSLCVSTKEHAGLRAGRVYFTDDELEHAAWRTEERNRYLYGRRGFQKRCIGVYDLKSGRMKKVRSSVERPSFWPPAAWFTPSTVST